MSSKDVEIELKLPLFNAEEVRAFLSRSAEMEHDRLFQRDSYFVPPHRDFLGYRYPYEWLRLRETPKGTSLNYKHFHPENVEWPDYCDEFETVIEKADAVMKIFRSLDFRELIVVEKHRSTWAYMNTEVAIDDVEELGSFIEIEARDSFEDPKKGSEFLFKVLGTLGAKVGRQDNRGYPYLLLEKRGRKGT